MEYPDSVHVEVQIAGAWVDLWPDVLHNPPPSVTGIGILDNNPLTRVGNISAFTFTLNNSENNSHQTRGYYSPGTPNVLSGWAPGLYVRMYVVYDGIYKSVFYGRIDADGIAVTTGTNRQRQVEVRASGWMKEAANRSLEMIDYQTNQRSDRAAALVITNMPIPPLVQSYQVGVETFPTVFDITRASTKAASELDKIASSELGFIYIRGDRSTSAYVGGETLVFENRRWRYSQRNTPSSIPYHSSEANDFLLLETGDKILLETGDRILLEGSHQAYFSDSDILDMQVSYGKYLSNRVRITGYPRRVDGSAVVLWNLEKPLAIAAGASVRGLRGSYRDPSGKNTRVSGINMISPAATTDYKAYQNEDGSGTDYTASLSVSASYGTSEVEYIITNNDAADVYVTLLQARGYGVYTYDTASVLYESTGSMADYGVQEIELELPYISNATNLFNYSNNIDLILLETGDKILLEDGKFMRADDTAGVFDLLVYDEPTYYIDSVTLNANRDKNNMMAFMCLDAGSFVYIQESMTGITTNATYCINGYDMEIQDGKHIFWKPQLVSTLRYPRI